MMASTTEESEDDEEEDEDEGNPEYDYAHGSITVHEFKDLKAQQRVDALYVLTEQVTGVDFLAPEHRKVNPLKTIGFVQ